MWPINLPTIFGKWVETGAARGKIMESPGEQANSAIEQSEATMELGVLWRCEAVALLTVLSEDKVNG